MVKMKMRLAFQIFIILTFPGLISFLSGCAFNPVSKRHEFVLMSEAQEIELGQKLDPQIIEEYGYYEDDDLQDYIDSVGQKLARLCDRPDLYFRFKITNSPVVNAFALPGGYIYINRGLLALLNSEAELAGVLGHEIGHVCARHHVRQYTKQTSYQIISGIATIIVPETKNLDPFADMAALAIIRGFGREQELEADHLGMKYSSQADYDLKALEDFLKILKRMEKESDKPGYHGLFSSHPETGKRIREILKGKSKFGIKPGGEVLSNRYKSKIDGLLYGPDPREGVVTNNIFKHPVLSFEVIFPLGWEIENRKTMLGAKHPEKDYYIQMKVQNLNKRSKIKIIADKVSRKMGLREVRGDLVKINGLSAYQGIYRGREASLGNISVTAAFIIKEDKVYQLFGFSKPYVFDEARHYFDKTIHSFRGLSRKEAKEIKPNRIRIYTIKKGDTLENITRRFGRKLEEVKKIAILNNLTIGDPLKMGEKIKIVIDKPLAGAY